MDSQFLDRVNTIRKITGSTAAYGCRARTGRAQHLGTVPASEPVQAPAVSELDAFEERARAAARKIIKGAV
jgi:hypothetical protein